MLKNIKRKKHLSLLCIFICWGSFIGCTPGPTYSRPRTIAHKAKRFIHLSPVLDDANIPLPLAPWWKEIHDPVTGTLVEKALLNNTDIQALAARIMESKAILEIRKGIQKPQISYSLSSNRSKNILTTPFGEQEKNVATTFDHNVSASYIIDLFGKLKRNEQAAWADLLSIEANYEALMHIVISEVVRLRVRIATLQQSLTIACENRKNWHTTLRIIEERYGQGLISSLDVRLARENLAASKINEIQSEQSLITTLLSLDVLLGQQPGLSTPLPETLPDLPDPGPVPPEIPAALLDRRPDIRAAEMRLASATAGIGATMAQLFPDVSLTASTGFRSEDLAGLVMGKNHIYSAIMQILQPLFRGGQIKAQVRAAQARAREAAANYTGVILIALKDVENALVREKMLTQNLDELTIRHEQARAAEKLAKDRYNRGIDGIITVLETERRKNIAQKALITTKGEIWNARIDLFLALGGDWGK